MLSGESSASCPVTRETTAATSCKRRERWEKDGKPARRLITSSVAFYVAFLLCFIYYVLFMEPFIMNVCFRVCGCWNPPPLPLFYSITFRPRRASSCCTWSPPLVSSNPAVVIADIFRISPAHSLARGERRREDLHTRARLTSTFAGTTPPPTPPRS